MEYDVTFQGGRAWTILRKSSGTGELFDALVVKTSKYEAATLFTDESLAKRFIEADDLAIFGWEPDLLDGREEIVKFLNDVRRIGVTRIAMNARSPSDLVAVPKLAPLLQAFTLPDAERN